MEAAQGPLIGLTEALGRFVMVRRLRMLHVLTDSDLRIMALDHIAAAEHHRGNKTPFFILEAPADVDDSWSTRIVELQANLEEARQEVPENASGRRPAAPAELNGTGDLQTFGLELVHALISLPEHLEGLTIVLAPLRVQARARWFSDLLALLKPRELERARFIVVDLDTPVSGLVADRLGEDADFVDARLGAMAAQDGLKSRLASMGMAPSGACGVRLLGAAGPKVAPPPRVDQPEAIAEQEGPLAETRSSEALSDPDVGRDLGKLMLGAVLALQNNEPVEAVRNQREASDLCRREGLVRESIVLKLMLASALLQMEKVKLALRTIDEARSQAEEEELHELVVQAVLAQAMVLLLQKRPEEAAQAYEQAGRIAQERGFVVLAIEAYRVCGQILVSRERIELAVKMWKRALELAEASPPEVVCQSSAPQMARALASLCRKHGLADRAQELESQADAFENPSVPKPTVEEQPVLETSAPVVSEPAVPQAPPESNVGKTIEMVIDRLFPDESELPERHGAEAEAEDWRNQEWVVEVAAMATISGGADLFDPADMSVFRRDPTYAKTVEMEATGQPKEERKTGGFRAVSFRDPKYARTIEMRAIGADPVEQPRSSPLLATMAIRAVVVPEAFRVPHHTQRRSMEMDVLSLPGDDEPPKRGRS